MEYVIYDETLKVSLKLHTYESCIYVYFAWAKAYCYEQTT